MGIFSNDQNDTSFKLISEKYDVKVIVYGYGIHGDDPIVRGLAQDGSFTTIGTWLLSYGLKKCVEDVWYTDEWVLFHNLICDSTKYIKNEIEIVSDITSTTSTPRHGSYHVMLEVQPKYHNESFKVKICLEPHNKRIR